MAKTNPPTLADAVIALGYEKTFARTKSQEPHKDFARRVASARKFVLDDTMSAFAADLMHEFWGGGQRKRLIAFDNARQQARLPHSLTWIELDFCAFMDRNKRWGIKMRFPNAPERFGWLFEQHHRIDTAFCCTEARSTVNAATPFDAWVHSVGMAWCSDDNPSPWRVLDLLPPTSDLTVSEACTKLLDYKRRNVHFIARLFDEDRTIEFLSRTMKDWHEVLPALDFRIIWPLLAIINDIPITRTLIAPTHGVLLGAKVRAYAKHTVLHLTVPDIEWKRLMRKSAKLIRKRAHQVRGHWRKDWRKPLAPGCEHAFSADMICQHCGGHKIWVPEHQRGDAGIGFVTHDYEVHHEKG
jgi:hypothetical protein